MTGALALRPPRRVGAQRIRRGVTYWLPWAPGAPCRNLFDRTPVEALREIIDVAGRRLREVEVRTDDPPLKHVDLMAEIEPGVRAPIASVVDGLSYAEAIEALAALHGQLRAVA